MSITVTELGPTVGTEIVGLAGGQLVDPAVARECLAAVDRRGVVIYREADVDDDQLVAFSRMLGEVLTVPNGAVEGHPEVAPVTRDRSKDAMAAYRQGTFFWHIDGANDLVPNKATLLTAKEISEDDEGDTEFANTYAAHDALPEAEQAELADVRVVHSFAAAQLLVHPDPTPEERALWDRVPSREHPLVWTRQDGRKSLLIGATAGEVVGRSPEDGRALLDRLLEWSTRPEFVVRHHWRRGDLVIWDNTGLLHRALPYPSDSPRLMHRTTIAGEEAIA
jgi:alpha-ketoglutarate-dependent taurine dioxygenase